MDSEPKKLVYEPEELPPGSPVPFCHVDKIGWTPMVSHSCTFAPEHFETIMVNLVRNPNLNSKWLFRADILYDDGESAAGIKEAQAQAPQTWLMQDFACERTMVRKLIPRNTIRDAPLDQTCFFYKSSDQETNQVRTLVVYRPHATAAAELPFYHPKVEAIAQLHEWDATANKGTISIHFLPFQDTEAADQAKLGRIAYHLLEIVHKHGHTTAAGYTKRVNHDVVVPREKFQDRYSELKNKYARSLVEGWAETTDPAKHVFEDLGIAAFLIELWAEMYRDSAFPGFVDIGCGNGLLVYVLRQEGYSGWGFDARERKSWAQYRSTTPSGDSLQRRLLLPSVVPREATNEEGGPVSDEDIHNGLFPEGTFIISNHADELTPWTPILATISQCPFIMIPCCSHNLTGERYRAPPPRDRTKGQSAFASLVDWVTRIAEDCGWRVETEMLRIPSTRNTGLLGRSRAKPAGEVDITAVMHKYGGVAGYYSNVSKLLKSAPRGH